MLASWRSIPSRGRLPPDDVTGALLVFSTDLLDHFCVEHDCLFKLNRPRLFVGAGVIHRNIDLQRAVASPSKSLIVAWSGIKFPLPSSQASSRNPMLVTTKVSPSHLPTEYPNQGRRGIDRERAFRHRFRRRPQSLAYSACRRQTRGRSNPACRRRLWAGGREIYFAILKLRTPAVG